MKKLENDELKNRIRTENKARGKNARMPGNIGQLEFKVRQIESQIRADFFSMGRGQAPRQLIGTMGESREDI